MEKENLRNQKITNLEIRKVLQLRKQAKGVKEINSKRNNHLNNNQTKRVSKTKARIKKDLRKVNKQRISKHLRSKSKKMNDQIYKNLCKKNKQ